MFVANRMTPNPITVSSTATIIDAMHLMKKHKFRRLPVVENGKLVGIVTDRDLREISPSQATSLSIFEINYLLSKMLVRDIMKKKLITVQGDATVEEAALLMYNHKIGGMVVLDADDKVIGVITETDIFKCFVDVMGLPEGKTRITLDLEDKVGALHEITAVFTELGINIGSLLCYSVAAGKAEIVIRADVNDIDGLQAELAKHGLPVRHIVQIG